MVLGASSSEPSRTTPPPPSRLLRPPCDAAREGPASAGAAAARAGRWLLSCLVVVPLLFVRDATGGFVPPPTAPDPTSAPESPVQTCKNLISLSDYETSPFCAPPCGLAATGVQATFVGEVSTPAAPRPHQPETEARTSEAEHANSAAADVLHATEPIVAHTAEDRSVEEQPPQQGPSGHPRAEVNESAAGDAVGTPDNFSTSTKPRDHPADAREQAVPLPTSPGQRKRGTPWLGGYADEGNLEQFDPRLTDRDLAPLQRAASPTFATVSSTTASSAPEISTPAAPVHDGDAHKRIKERFNYASFDCAAIILSTNPEAKGSTAILIGNKDQYMLNKCSAKKFVVIELCDEILVDTVAIANYEFFSSMFRDFQISVSNRWPPKQDGWVDLGRFRAKNSRDLQLFTIEHPTIFARYIRIDFNSHYGNEYYCPVSLVRVHGTTMMEQYKKEVEDHRSEDIHVASSGDKTIRMPDVRAMPSPVLETPLTYMVDPSKFVVEMGIPPLNMDRFFPDFSDMETPTGEGMCPSNLDPFATQPVGSPAESTGVPGQSERDDSNSEEYGICFDVTQMARESPSAASTEEARISAIAAGTPLSTPEHPDTLPVSGQGGGGATSPRPYAGTASTVAQESIFKTIMKRLAAVEHNATVAHIHLQEQSKSFSGALQMLEKAQRTQLSAVIAQVNRTAVWNAENMNRKFKQYWEELENHKKKHKKELRALDSKLELLAEEVAFEKKLGLVQLVLLLSVLVFMGVGRFFRPPERVFIPVQPTYPETPRTIQVDSRRSSTASAASTASGKSKPRLSSSSVATSPLAPRLMFNMDNLNPAVIAAIRRRKKRRGTHPGIVVVPAARSSAFGSSVAGGQGPLRINVASSSPGRPAAALRSAPPRPQSPFSAATAESGPESCLTAPAPGWAGDETPMLYAVNPSSVKGFRNKAMSLPDIANRSNLGKPGSKMRVRPQRPPMMGNS